MLVRVIGADRLEVVATVSTKRARREGIPIKPDGDILEVDRHRCQPIVRTA
jgi:hypothetical protein